MFSVHTWYSFIERCIASEVFFVCCISVFALWTKRKQINDRVGNTCSSPFTPPSPPIKKTVPVDIIVSFFETGATGSYLVCLYTILRLCQDADRSLSGLSRVAAGGANPGADPRGGRTRGRGW